MNLPASNDIISPSIGCLHRFGINKNFLMLLLILIKKNYREANEQRGNCYERIRFSNCHWGLVSRPERIDAENQKPQPVLLCFSRWIYIHHRQLCWIK